MPSKPSGTQLGIQNAIHSNSLVPLNFMVLRIKFYLTWQGWRGPLSKLDISGDWGVRLADVRSLSDVAPWRMAVVLEVSDQSARIGFQPGHELGGAVSRERQTGLVTLDGVKWAKATTTRGKAPTAVSQVLSPGDVIYVDPLYREGNPVEGQL